MTKTAKTETSKRPWWLSENGMRVLERRYLQKNTKGEFIEDADGLLRRVCLNQAHIDALWAVLARHGFGEYTDVADMSDGLIQCLKKERYRNGIDGWSPVAEQTYVDELDKHYRSYREMMDKGLYLPSTPILLNSNARSGMLYACFVIPMDDMLTAEGPDYTGIFDTVKAVVMVQKSGGGTGMSVGRMRERGAPIFCKQQEEGIVFGHTQGAPQWLEAVSDAVRHIEQGSARHGANMGILPVDHPDIIEFIGYKDGQRLRNFNVSVGMTDAFVHALQHDADQVWFCVSPHSGQQQPCRDKLGTFRDPEHDWTVREIFELMVDRAWQTGDPGLWFIDRVNADNPTPNVNSYESCNPCGEQQLLPYESCNLGSVVLPRFVTNDVEAAPGALDIASIIKEGVNWPLLEQVVRRAVRFHEAVIDANIYIESVPQIREATKKTRKIGLGVMGWWDMLVRLGIPYESEEALTLAEAIMEHINKTALQESEELARERRPFPAWEGSREQERGRRPRNATRTTIAPTGTISILANVTGGIEPAFGLAFLRNAPGIGYDVEEVNATFQEWLDEAVRNGRLSEDSARELLEDGFYGRSIAASCLLNNHEKALFKVANEIDVSWHMRHQAAFQKHTDNAVSKSVNMANSATRDDVRNAYLLAIDLGLKGTTIFRDGCLDFSNQVQTMAHKKEEAPPPAALPMASNGAVTARVNGAAPSHNNPPRDMAPKPAAVRPLRPQIGVSMRSLFGTVHLHITVDVASNRELEVFGCVGKAGELKLAQMEGMGRLISQILRLGGDMEMVVSQLKGIGSKHTTLSSGGRHLSLEDTVGRMLAKYLEAKKRWGLRAMVLGEISEEELQRFWSEPLADKKALDEAYFGNGGGDGEALRRHVEESNRHGLQCPACENELEMVGGCPICEACGWSKC